MLFEIANIRCEFTKKQWHEIEQLAYENSKAKTHADFVKSMCELHPMIEVLGQYVNANKKVLVRCNKCGHEWEGVPANMLSGDGCRKCGTKIPIDSLFCTKCGERVLNFPTLDAEISRG